VFPLSSHDDPRYVPAHHSHSALRGDRKAQAKGIRQAHGLSDSYYKESRLIRSAAEEKLREADRLECEEWSAIMWAGGPARVAITPALRLSALQM
jgi:hypothetical protein